MSAPFDGPDRAASDLRVGEIRALRTFRLSQGGSLLPVFHNNVPWSDGPNRPLQARLSHPGRARMLVRLLRLRNTARHVPARPGQARARRGRLLGPGGSGNARPARAARAHRGPLGVALG
jgi:hypothetical protein